MLRVKRLVFSSLFVMAFGLIAAAEEQPRCSMWVDLYLGEPVEWETMMEDLLSVEMIIIGESHRLQRHHKWQTKIIESLASQNRKVLLGVEPLEAQFMNELQRYNEGKITFEELAERISWAEKWSNYRDYQPLFEATLDSGGRVVALNADADVIRKIARQGFNSLTNTERSSLPNDIHFEEPLYEKLLNKVLLIHMTFTEEVLNQAYRAQVSRDETMAEQMALAWQSIEQQSEWIGVVVCGSGHCSYGLGLPSRLQRRLPDTSQRIVLMSESGETELTEAEKAMKRDLDLSHADLRFLQRPIADYLQVIEAKENDEE